MKNTVKWSKEKILREIRAFHKSGRPLNPATVTKEHRLHGKLFFAAIGHFGSWRNAVEAAGFDYKPANRKWSKEKVLEEIRAFHKSGRPLNHKIVLREHHHNGKLVDAARFYFGSWRKAIEAAGYDYERVIERWSKEKIIAEINRLNEAGEWLSYTDVHRSHSALVSAAGEYFGSWGKAVKAAGFPYELIKEMKRKESSLMRYKASTIKWTDEMIISQIRLFYRFKKILQFKVMAENNRKLLGAAVHHFGSWREAVEAAGFNYDQFLTTSRWTNKKIISGIQSFYRTKKTLRCKDVRREDSKLYSAAVDYFGNWRNAVEAAGFDYEQFLFVHKWTKKEVISKIKAYYKAKRTSRYREICREYDKIHSAARKYFGSWRRAVEAAGFNYDRLLLQRRWTKEKIISEIQSFYRTKKILRSKDIRREDSKLYSAACLHFGSWRKAVEAAGFDYDQCLPKRKWTKGKVISEIKTYYKTKKTLQCEEICKDNPRLYSAANKYFGGWRQAVEAAGFDYKQFFRRKEREQRRREIIFEIKAYYKAKGTLRYKGVRRSNQSLVSAAFHYFGNWRKAVEAAGFDYDQFLLQRRWTKEKVISEIRILYEAKKTLQIEEILWDNRKLYSAARRYFGSWGRAVEAAGFDYKQFLRRKEREQRRREIISGIKAFYKAKGTLQYKKICKLNQPLVGTAFRYFGNWRNAVEAAGFDYDQFLLTHKWTKEEILSGIKAFYKAKGTLQYRVILQFDNRLLSAGRSSFGSWRKAVEAVGFDYDQFLLTHKWRKEEVISGIQAFYKAEATLRYKEVRRKDKKLYSAGCRFFGSWRKAVEAAGFDYDQFPPVRKWTKERIISGIKAFYKAKGTLQNRVVLQFDNRLYYAGRRYFGSWRRAVEAAGFNYDQFRGGKG